MEKGEIDLAIKDLSKVIELNPNHALVHVKRAEAYMKKGEIDLAIRDYSKVIELFPDEAQSDYLFLRGVARLRIRDSEGAKEDFIAIQNKGSDISVLFLEKYGSITDAEEEFGVKLSETLSLC